MEWSCHCPWEWDSSSSQAALVGLSEQGHAEDLQDGGHNGIAEWKWGGQATWRREQ